MKKNVLIILLTIISKTSLAMPSMNDVVGSRSIAMVTVVRDNSDHNLFYIFPQKMGLKKNNDKFVFLAQEFKEGVFRPTKGYVSMSFTPYFDKEAVINIVSEIVDTNPSAKFAIVPSITSNISAPMILFPGLEKISCESVSGTLMQDVSCNLVLTNQGLKLFKRTLNQTVVNIFQFSYDFFAYSGAGLMKLSHSIPMYAGELQLSYFIDQKGSPYAEWKEEKVSFGASVSEIQREVKNILVKKEIPSEIPIREIKIPPPPPDNLPPVVDVCAVIKELCNPSLNENEWFDINKFNEMKRN